jgi:hypothetical protein
MQLAGTTAATQYDQLHVGGALAFAGTLNVTLLNAFTPMPRQQFDLFDFASHTGTFGSVNLPALPPGETWDSSALYTTGTIATVPLLNGDTNGDGVVNVGDLGSLATNYGMTSGATWSQGDFNADGSVNVGDLGVLATNYGQSVGGGGSVVGTAANVAATSASVPEPCGALMLLGALLGGILPRRRR